MELIPIGESIIVIPDVAKDKSEGGIILTQDAKEIPQTGEVIAVGPGLVNNDGSFTPLTIRPGDRVLFKTYSGDNVELEGVVYKIIDEIDILAILR